MKDRMTSRERLLAAIQRRPVDHVPCSPFLNPQDRIQRLGQTYNFPFGPSREETLQYAVEVLELDMVVSVSWQSFFPEPEVSSRMRLKGDVLKKVWSTPAGELVGSIRYDASWPHGYDVPFFTDYSIGRIVEPWLKTEQDLACLKHILLPPQSDSDLEALRFGWQEAKYLADAYQLATILEVGTGLSGAHQICDSERLCLMAIDNPDLIDGYLELEHSLNLKSYEIALDMGVDIIRRNGFYETTDFFSPALLSRFLKQRIREEADLVHQAGGLIGYTVLTGYTPMTGHLADLGLDCIIVPDPFFEGEKPQDLRDTLQETTSFWTGPSDTLHMPWDNQEAVRQAVRDTFAIFGKTGLIIAACSSCKAPFPWENTLAMVDEWKKLR